MFEFYSFRPGLRLGSLDKKPNTKRETKKIITVYTNNLSVSITIPLKSLLEIK